MADKDEGYAIVWLATDEEPNSLCVHTLVYRHAPYPESELPENQEVRTYTRGLLRDSDEIAETYDEALKAMFGLLLEKDPARQLPFRQVAVPVQVARTWFPAMRFSPPLATEAELEELENA